MTKQIGSEPVALHGDHCRQDAFSLALQAAGRHFGRQVDYDTVYALSTNAFAPDIRSDEPCRCSWCKQGRGRALDLVAARLGLKVETAADPQIGSLRTALGKGEMVLTDLEWGPGALWCDWGFLTGVQDDGSILGTTVDGPDRRLAEVRGAWHFLSPTEPTMTPREADLAMLRRAVERINSKGVFAAGKDAAGREVLFGLAAVDAWAATMRQVPYSPGGPDASRRQAYCTAWAVSGGAEVAARALRHMARDFSPRAALSLRNAASRYDTIVALLLPALTGKGGESYEQFMGDGEKQRHHADQVLLRVRDRLQTAARQMELALRTSEALPGQVRPPALEALAAQPAMDEELVYLPAGVPAAMLAALRQAGVDLIFDDFVAGTGWAFSFGYSYENWMPAVLAPTVPPEADVPFEAFNWLPERLGFALEGVPSSDGERFWAFVKEHVDAGRLLVSEHYDGGLIYGYRETAGQRQVWFDGPVGFGWVSVPDVQGLAFVMRRTGSAMSEREMYRQALARAINKAESGRRGGAPQGLAALEAYRRDVADPGKDFKDGDRPAWFCWCAFERLTARLCCARWLKKAAGILGAEARAHLLAASERYARAYARYDRYREEVGGGVSTGGGVASRVPERIAAALPPLDDAIAEERAGIEEMKQALAALCAP